MLAGLAIVEVAVAALDTRFAVLDDVQAAVLGSQDNCLRLD